MTVVPIILPVPSRTTSELVYASGQVGQIVDPNSLVITLTYWPRGWLKSKKVRSEMKTYDYDGVVQLKKTALVDNSYMTYAYDDAHRLTDVKDSLGNGIHYILDNMGDRKIAEVRDPGNVLSRDIKREFDALNRVPQITGAAQ